MSKVLVIKANPKSDAQSNTFQLLNVFLEAYQKQNPQDEIVVLDLYQENIYPLDMTVITKMFSGVDNIAKNHARLFESCDKYIFAAPMWNLSFPSLLKAYFDYVSYVGVTFKYTEAGPVGLLSNRYRKALHVVSRGGQYSEGPAKDFEQGDKYIRTLLDFLGVNEVQTLALEKTNVLKNEALEEHKATVYEDAKQLAKIF